MNAGWAGRNVVVVGGGRSGSAAAGLLAQVGATVTITDARDAAALGLDLDSLAARGISVALEGHPGTLWEGADAVVASPGIAPTAPPLSAARSARLPIISEIELAAQFAKAPAIAITGSNGKSTVTAMTSAILEAHGLVAPACGNIGVPWSELVAAELRGEISPDRYVLELSSFQTEAIAEFRPRWAAVLNLSADHLDRHGSFDEYAAAKMRIVHNATPSDHLVYGADDAEIAARLPASPRRVPFSHAPIDDAPAAWLENGRVFWRSETAAPAAVVALEELQVLGRHNGLNAAAATALACLAGATTESAGTALRAFRGLDHRTELCGTINGVRCVNDSKATNVGATIAALRGIDAPIWLILGGRDKDSDFTLLLPHLEGHVKGVLLVGEASQRIGDALDGAIATTACETLDNAVVAGLEAATVDDVLLLAPACTSFDQYTDFEERGKHFRELIAARADTQ